MEELNSIIGEMIANGEPQEVMDAVIAEWENRNPGVLNNESLNTESLGAEQSNFDEIIPEDQNWFERNIF